jgi:hypothetical protein
MLFCDICKIYVQLKKKLLNTVALKLAGSLDIPSLQKWNTEVWCHTSFPLPLEFEPKSLDKRTQILQHHQPCLVTYLFLIAHWNLTHNHWINAHRSFNIINLEWFPVNPWLNLLEFDPKAPQTKKHTIHGFDEKQNNIKFRKSLN